MTGIKNIIFVVLLLLFGTLMAQNNAAKGDRYFDKNLFQEAIKYYELEAKSGKKNTVDYATLRLADCYRIIGEFELAEETYRKILKKKRNQENPLSYLNYGKSLKSSAKYEEAKIQFETYIQMQPNDPMGKVYLHSCDSAQRWLEETIGKEITNVGKINTETSDFSPIIFNSNQLVFSSSRQGSKSSFISFNGGLEVSRMDIYKVDIESINTDHEIQIKNISEFNSPLHDGAITFTKDGNEAYFTRSIRGKKVKKANEILSTQQIFYSKKDSNEVWSLPQSAFSFNSEKYSVGHPSISEDGETLFFVSDMPGGFGFTDVYYIEKREDGSWDETPINVGSEINTFGHELFPFIADDGTLYFSSDAHPGMGQLDILSAKKVDGEWTNVVNLKPPYNSIGNDFGMVLDGKSFRGFLSSDRSNGKGAEDIYSFSENVPLDITFKGNSIEFADKNIFDGLQYSIKNESTEQDSALVLSNGQYSFPLENGVNYTLVAKKNRFAVHNKISLQLNVDNIDSYFELTINSLNQPIKLSGNLLIVQNIDTIKTNIPIANKLVVLSDSARLEVNKTSSEGLWQLVHDFLPAVEYKIVASKTLSAEDSLTYFVEKQIPQNEKNVVYDSLTVSGSVIDKTGKKIEAKLIIRENGKIINEVITSDEGLFNLKLLASTSDYEILILAEGYYPEVLSISSHKVTDQKEITKKIKLNKIAP